MGIEFFGRDTLGSQIAPANPHPPHLSDQACPGCRLVRPAHGLELWSGSVAEYAPTIAREMLAPRPRGSPSLSFWLRHKKKRINGSCGCGMWLFISRKPDHEC